MSARDELEFALGEGLHEMSSGWARINAQLDAFRAEVLHEAAELLRAERQRYAPRAMYSNGIEHGARFLDRMADEAGQEKDTREGESTPDFFQPGHTYAYDADGFTAPELLTVFRVVAETTQPETGKRMAFGWIRTAEDVAWSPYAEPVDEWPACWTDITTTGEDSRS
jgi:hypothetical protein